MVRWLIYYDDYLPFHEEKDIGQIALGLQEVGEEVVFVTLAKEGLREYKAPFKLYQVEKIDDFLESDTYDNAIVYSWIDPRYNSMLEKFKKITSCLIVKADSDGRLGVLGEPVRRFDYFKKIHTPPRWKVLPRLLKGFYRRVAEETEKARIYQMNIVDKIVIESPDASQNISTFISRKGCYKLIDKLNFIPDPVTPDFSRKSSCMNNKKNIVVSIGRWNDWIPKNPEIMICSLGLFLNNKADWESVIIGPGLEVINSFMSRVSYLEAQRIKLMGEVKHSIIKKYLSNAKIFFMPSRSESFGIAAGEALCQGCTVVGSPIEPLRFMARQGFSGNNASSFSESAFVGALLYEAKRWERGEVNPEEIAEYWKNILDRRAIAQQYVDMVRGNK